MVSINIRIEHDATKDKGINPYLNIACDLLQREDADDIEWQIAKVFEDTLKLVLKKIDKDTIFKLEI